MDPAIALPMPPALEALFQPGSVIVETRPALVDEQLFPEERAHLQRAVEKRRAEFGAARVAARQALCVLGYPPGPLVPGVRGAPTWPEGCAGSITHTEGYCAVVVARSPPTLSVGIDAEKIRPLEDGVERASLTPSERGWLAREPLAEHVALGMLFFSAKEAYYKCQYPLSGIVLDFREVEIRVDLAARAFEASTRNSDVPPQVARLGGRFLFRAGYVICGVELISERR